MINNNNAVDKIYKKLFKDKVYTIEIRNVKVWYRITKVCVSTSERFKSSTYTCNIVVDTYKSVHLRFSTQKRIRTYIGKLIRRHVEHDHMEMVGDLKYFNFTPKNRYQIDMIRWK